MGNAFNSNNPAIQAGFIIIGLLLGSVCVLLYKKYTRGADGLNVYQRDELARQAWMDRQLRGPLIEEVQVPLKSPKIWEVWVKTNQGDRSTDGITSDLAIREKGVEKSRLDQQPLSALALDLGQVQQQTIHSSYPSSGGNQLVHMSNTNLQVSYIVCMPQQPTVRPPPPHGETSPVDFAIGMQQIRTPWRVPSPTATQT